MEDQGLRDKKLRGRKSLTEEPETAEKDDH
jgi:hypothetical protein